MTVRVTVLAADLVAFFTAVPALLEVVFLPDEEVDFFDDEEDVLSDLVGCKYSLDPQGRDIYDLSDEEWDKLYQSVPWVKCIVVYITT